jgi:uncharacterized RDD family membrane protein YckC
VIEHVRGRYAGLASRVLADGVDIAVLAIACVGSVWFTEAAWALVHLQPVGSISINPAVTAVTVPAIVIGYFVLGWSIFGKTVGKLLFGLRVVRPDGRRVGVLRSALRLFLAIGSVFLLFVGYGWIAVDRRRRAWHDIVANTVVVYDWDDDRGRVDLAPVAPHA